MRDRKRYIKALLAALMGTTFPLVLDARHSHAHDRQANDSRATVSQSMKQLIEDARREGRLNLFLVSSQGAKGGKALGDAFNRRFGLENIAITVDLSRGSAGDAHKAIAEHEAGIPARIGKPRLRKS
jgi:hypothetical protein